MGQFESYLYFSMLHVRLLSPSNAVGRQWSKGALSIRAADRTVATPRCKAPYYCFTRFCRVLVYFSRLGGVV